MMIDTYTGRVARGLSLSIVLLVLCYRLVVNDGHAGDDNSKRVTPDYQGVAIGPDIPPDVALTQENRQRDMDLFSWKSFIALNWPRRADGDADYRRVIGDSTNGDNSTVWEQWISTADIYDIPEGVEPSWGKQFVPEACSKNNDYKPGMKVLSSVSKSDDFFEQAFDSGPLTDQAGAFVRYEISINKEMFQTIKDNKLYRKAGQQRANSVSFTCGDNGTGDEGAIMVKAAWKVLSSSDDKGRYHTNDAMVFTPAKYRSDNLTACDKKTVGLVGLHIVHKTKQQPQWIWSSFEQVDNLPACDNQNTFFTDPSKLNKPSCPQQETSQYSFYASSSGQSILPQAACNTAPKGNAGSTKYHLDKPGSRSQLCRENALETSAPPLNLAYQTLLNAINSKSVWKYYRLIGTQWNSNIAAACGKDTRYVAKNVLPQYKIKNSSAGIVPLPLANSTMEGYQQSSSSCIQCHSGATINAKGVEIPSDFVWFLSQELDQ